MKEREKLNNDVIEELARYGLSLSTLEKLISTINRWLEEHCSSVEVVLDDPYMEIANQAINKAVYSARDFIVDELKSKGLDYKTMEDVWQKVLSEHDMKGLEEDRYVDYLVNQHFNGENVNNYSLSEYLDENEINKQFVETPQERYSFRNQLYTAYIFRLLEKRKPKRKKNDFLGHDISVEEKKRSTVKILKYYKIEKTVSGVTSAIKDIESKENEKENEYNQLNSLKTCLDNL